MTKIKKSKLNKEKNLIKESVKVLPNKKRIKEDKAIKLERSESCF